MSKKSVQARCETTKDMFIIEFQQKGDGDKWFAVSAAKQSSENSSESSKSRGKQRITGEFVTSPEYDGCPYCNQTAFFYCGPCGNLPCYDGVNTHVTCPWCQSNITLSGDIEKLDAMDDGVQRNNTDTRVHRED